MSVRKEPLKWRNWRGVLQEVIYEADTLPGKIFDVVLIIAIVVSLITVFLDSVPQIHAAYYQIFLVIEWFFTILFTLEYALRIISVKKPVRYIFSFFGLVDFIAIVPTYLGLFFVGMHSFLVVRSLRLLRIFRILKLANYLGEAQVLRTALYASRRKVTVFLSVVLTIVVIFASSMYLVEGERSGFTSIPKAMYWAIVTVTTVGYGDTIPHTVVGQIISAILMILGYAIIAVPTGIVTAELTQRYKKPVSTQACPTCSADAHELDAKFCRLCGAKL